MVNDVNPRPHDEKVQQIQNSLVNFFSTFDDDIDNINQHNQIENVLTSNRSKRGKDTDWQNLEKMMALDFHLHPNCNFPFLKKNILELLTTCKDHFPHSSKNLQVGNVSS